ncbi:hypothetical protein DV738_g3483, partial [Chaetothyriales sp. CBS 135597]
MVPSLKSFYRATSPARQAKHQPGGGRRRPAQSKQYSASESEEWPSFRAPAASVKTAVDLFDEESPPTSPREQTSIALSIPLPWPKKFSRRSSSVPASAEARRWPDQAPSPDAHITSPIPGALVSAEPHPLVKTVSPSLANSKHTHVPPTRPLLLSPVNEGFGSPDSAETTSDPSPITPIDQDSQEDFNPTNIATSLYNYTIAGPRPTQAARNVEVASVIPARDDRRASRLTHRNEPAPGLAATAFMRSPPMSAPYGYQWELRARSPSVPAVTSKAITVPPSSDHRRVPSDGSANYRHSAATSRHSSRTTDDDSSMASEERHSRSSRGSWQQLSRTQKQQQHTPPQPEVEAGGSDLRSLDTYAIGPAFYRSVTDDYKKILRDPGDGAIATTTNAPLSRSPSAQGMTAPLTAKSPPPQQKQKQKAEIETLGEPGPEIDIIVDSDDNISPLHTLVPSGKELWG